MITYSQSVKGLEAEQLQGFFVGWPNPPKTHTHLKMLQNSSHVVLAIEEESNRVVGFINAISDGVLSSYIPLLEVLPEYLGQGIGQELVRQMLEQLKHLYMVDIVCDQSMADFYARLNLRPSNAMILRHYDRQAGE